MMPTPEEQGMMKEEVISQLLDRVPGTSDVVVCLMASLTFSSFACGGVARTEDPRNDGGSGFPVVVERMQRAFVASFAGPNDSHAFPGACCARGREGG